MESEPTRENDEDPTCLDLQDQYFLRREILIEVLIPLHLPNDMILWRDQVPVLQNYHEDLVRCILCLIDKVG